MRPFCHTSINRASRVLAITLLTTITATATVDAALNLPFHEKFSGDKLDPAWEQHVSADNKLDIADGRFGFIGAAHGIAHIQREAGQDLITVSARIAQWGSVYLVWNDGDWCGAGQISPTPFGRLFSTVTKHGEGDEEDHRGVDFGLARWVQIQLGENFIRFRYSNDGKEWTELRTVARDKQFAGAPRLLVAGKYYESGDQPFAVQRTAEKSEDKFGGRVLELKVEANASTVAKLTAEELKKLREPKVDPVTAYFNGTTEDPSYESIVNYYPAMKSPREVVGVAAHPLDIGVDRLGRLDVSPWSAPIAWFEIGDPAVPLGKEGEPFKRRLLKGYLPVDTLSITRDGIECELTVYGWSEEFSVTKPLYAFTQLKLRATSGHTLPQKVALVTPNNKRYEWTPKISGDVAQLCLRMKYPEPASAEEISADEFTSKQEEVVSVWEKRLTPAMRFDVPETRVMEGYRAWLTYSMLNADTINGFIEPHDGAGFYEEMFGNSVSVHSMAMDVYGLHDYSAQLLDTQRHFQQTNGLYTQVCGLTDPGGFLAGLARHYRMTGDKAWLEKVRPNILRQCDWLIEQRAKVPTKGVTKGLIKFRPYNDYSAETYNYLGNIWCAQGMKETAEALETIGAPEAKRIAEEAKKYRADILESMASATIKRQGLTLLPLEPDTHRMLKLERYKAAGYYSLSACPLLGIGFLSPDDKRTTWFVDALEKRGGFVAGVCEFETGIDHAYTYGYLLNELKRHEPRKTILGFYSMQAFGMTRDTYSPVEVTMIETGDNHFTLPHLYSCTEQLRLLRSLLLFEDGDDLRMGEGIPRAWLEPGKKVSVKAAPTEFGEISYELLPQADGSIRVHIEPPQRRTPAHIRLTLREAQGRRIASVESAGERVKFSGETIVLAKPTGTMDFVVRFKSK